VRGSTGTLPATRVRTACAGGAPCAGCLSAVAVDSPSCLQLVGAPRLNKMRAEKRWKAAEMKAHQERVKGRERGYRGWPDAQ
jgi:hypothetical protein